MPAIEESNLKKQPAYRHSLQTSCVLFCFLCCTSGCGKDSEVERQEIVGKVTYKGQNIPKGRIDFLPETAGPAGYAMITNSTYDTRAEGRGVVPGPHSVRINGYDGTPSDVEGMRDGLPLFPPYQTTVEITSQQDLYEFDVESSRQRN